MSNLLAVALILVTIWFEPSIIGIFLLSLVLAAPFHQGLSHATIKFICIITIILRAASWLIRKAAWLELISGGQSITSIAMPLLALVFLSSSKIPLIYFRLSEPKLRTIILASIAFSCLLQPGLVSLPLVLTTLLCIGSPSLLLNSRLIKVGLSLYSGAILTLTYLLQQPFDKALHPPSWLGHLLGIESFTHSIFAEGLVGSLLGISHLTSLHLLFFASSSKGLREHNEHPDLADALIDEQMDEDGFWDVSAIASFLEHRVLFFIQPTQPLLLPLLLLCLPALIFPSVIGTILLFLALTSLMSASASKALLKPLKLLLIAWITSSFILTSLDASGILRPPSALHSILGLVEVGSSSTPGGEGRPTLPLWYLGTLLLQGLTFLLLPSSAPTAQLPSHHPTSPAGWQRAAVHAVWLFSLLKLVPLTWIMLGISHLGFLDAVYIIWAAFYFSWWGGIVKLGGSRLSPKASHRVMRGFSSLHLMAFSLVQTLWLPGLLPPASRAIVEPYLSLFGLVNIESHVSYILASLIFITAHAAAGDWLLLNSNLSAADPNPTSFQSSSSFSSSESEVDLIARSLLGQILGESLIPSPSTFILNLARISLPLTGAMLAIFDLFSQDPFTLGRPCSVIGALYLLLAPILLFSEALYEWAANARPPALTYFSFFINRNMTRRALGAFCITELLMQYFFTLVVELDLFTPTSWLRETIGLVSASDASELFLIVARPMTLLIITLMIQRLSPRPGPPNSQLPLSTEAYGGWQNFIARLVVLHGDTALSILLLTCSLLEPGVLGLALLTATGLFVVLGGSNQRILVTLVLFLIAWILSSYLILIPSIYGPLFSLKEATDWAHWLGLPIFASGYEIERGLDQTQMSHLVMKMLSILIACSRIASRGWVHNIPPQIFNRAVNVCRTPPLFWPLAEEIRPKSDLNELSSSLILLWRWRAMSFLALSMGLIESFWATWGLDISLLSLLVTSCLSSTAPSLLLLPFIITAMTNPYSSRRINSWKSLLLPFLSFLLILHYGSLVGWDEIFFPLRHKGPSPPHSKVIWSDILLSWLGLDDVDITTVVSVFLSLLFCSFQVRADVVRELSDQQEAVARRDEGRGGNGAEGQGRQNVNHVEIFQSLDPESRPLWTFADWARYYAIKHSLDLLLIAVVVVCTVQRDVVHAGYLALALMFFRERRRLRAERPTDENNGDDRMISWLPSSPSALFSPSSTLPRTAEPGGRHRGLFWVLPAFNFAVLLLELLFQMPIQLLLPGQGWGSSCEEMRAAAISCSLPQLLGLCKISSSSSLFASPALFDLLLFVLLRMYAKLSRSEERRMAMVVLAKADEEAARRLKVIRGAAKAASAREALKEARIEASRKRRAVRLKRVFATGINGPLGSQELNLLSSLLDSDSEDSNNIHQPTGQQNPAQSSHADPATLERTATDLRPRGHYRLTDSDLPLPLHTAASLVPSTSSSSAAHTIIQHSSGSNTPVQASKGLGLGHLGFRHMRNSSISRLGNALGLSPLITAASGALARGEGGRGRGGGGGGGGGQGAQGSVRRTLDDTFISTPPPFAPEAMTITTSRWGLPPLLDWCKAQLSLGDDENLLVLVALFIPFLIDVSLITSVLPLASLLYSLLAQFKGRAFWHGCLVYLESVLIAQYTFQVLRCATLSDARSEWYYAMIGFHFHPYKDIPLFVCYLSALFHTYRLSQVKSASIQHSDQQAKVIIASILPLNATSFWPRLVKLACYETVKFSLRLVKFFREIVRVYCLVSLPHELSPQWIKVEISWPQGLERRQAPQPSRHRQTASLDSPFPQLLDLPETVAEEIPVAEEISLPSQDPAAPQHSPPPPPLDPFQDPAARDVEQPAPLPLRSSPGHREAEALILVESTLKVSPLCGPLEWLYISRVQHMTPQLMGPHHHASALIEVKVRSYLDQSQETSSWSPPSAPICIARPAKLAADAINAKILRDEEDSDPLPFTPFVPRPRILSAAAFGSAPPDFYTTSSLLDLLFILYMAVCYQTILFSSLSSSTSTTDNLSEAANNGLPLSFLLVMMSLSGLMIVERIIYIAGSHASKLALHVVLTIGSFTLGFMLLWRPIFWWRVVTGTFSSPLDDGNVAPEPSAAAKFHLRILFLLRLTSLALSALQLRCGWPKQSSRHLPVFFAKPDQLRLFFYSAFCAIPFVSELRTLLDWGCTTTALGWYEWLKLEDIRASLFIATVRKRTREGARKMGAKVPSIVKWLQGFGLSALLLLVLWLPLLVFSSGAPTLQTPSLVSVDLKVSLSSIVSPRQPQVSDRSFQIFNGGGQWSSINGVPPSPEGEGGGELPHLPSGLSSYSPDQVKQLTLTPASEATFQAPRPAIRALEEMLVPPPSPSPPPSNSSSASSPPVIMTMQWTLVRSDPLSTQRGGPACTGSIKIPLAMQTRIEIVKVLEGSAEEAVIAHDDDDVVREGSGNPDRSPFALYPLFWRLGGENCVIQFDVSNPSSGGSRTHPPAPSHPPPPSPPHPSPPHKNDLNQPLNHNHQRWRWNRQRSGRLLSRSNHHGLAARPPNGLKHPPPPIPPDTPTPSPYEPTPWSDQAVSCSLSLQPFPRQAGPPSEPSWWELRCQTIDAASGSPILNSTRAQPTGPLAVVLLEKVQTGFLGATLSSFGITGLYLTFVYGLGRLLRLSTYNLRLHIPFEDLPSTRRLVSLCDDAYVARARGDLVLEEKLYRLIIAIYRSPSVLFELTQKRHIG